MKVSQLIELLNSLDPDAIVLLSQDSEGNGFEKLHSYGTGRAEKDELAENVGIEWYDDTHTDGECGLEPGERDTMEKVVVLWP